MEETDDQFEATDDVLVELDPQHLENVACEHHMWHHLMLSGMASQSLPGAIGGGHTNQHAVPKIHQTSGWSIIVLLIQ